VVGSGGAKAGSLGADRDGRDVPCAGPQPDVLLTDIKPLVAHGGVAGAIVELLVVLAVVALLVAVWLRERKASHEERDRVNDDVSRPS